MFGRNSVHTWKKVYQPLRHMIQWPWHDIGMQVLVQRDDHDVTSQCIQNRRWDVFSDKLSTSGGYTLFCGVIDMIQWLNIPFIEFKAAGSQCNGLSPGAFWSTIPGSVVDFRLFHEPFLSDPNPHIADRGRESKTTAWTGINYATVQGSNLMTSLLGHHTGRGNGKTSYLAQSSLSSSFELRN